jgi:hypothetical protein
MEGGIVSEIGGGVGEGKGIASGIGKGITSGIGNEEERSGWRGTSPSLSGD